ncbi:MAG: hypothetical protein ACR2NN_06065 [Bryobacteraceae bacterium]
MKPQTSTAQGLRIEQLAHLHELTKDVAKLCRTQLRTYLEALAPLFRPRRILGDYVEGAGKESIAGAEQNLTELREMYLKIGPHPFELRRELPTPIESTSTQIQLHEWEYLYEARAERDRKPITVVSPLTWVLSYPSTYSLSMLRQVMAGKQDRDPDSVRAFVLRACLMNLLFAKQPALPALFEGLRYRVEVRKQPQLGDLPLVTLSAPIPTVRPADDVLLMATGISGRTAFQEIIDVNAARGLADPFREQLAPMLATHGESF